MIHESYGIERVNVSALTAFSVNPRTHSDTQIDQNAASNREFGWTNPTFALPTIPCRRVPREFRR